MPHYCSVKRSCLEDTYCEQFNRESVHLVDIKNNPIKEVTETGITLEDGTHHELDVIALATGFDIVTGGITQLVLRSINGDDLDAQWSSGVQSYLGVTVRGYPNMGRWIAEAIARMRAAGVRYIDPKAEAVGAWRRRVDEASIRSLFPTFKSTYMGGSIPGKVYEPVCFVGGTDVYAKEIHEALEDREGGFDMVKDEGIKSML